MECLNYSNSSFKLWLKAYLALCKIKCQLCVLSFRVFCVWNSVVGINSLFFFEIWVIFPYGVKPHHSIVPMLHAMLIVFDERFINECAVLRWFSKFFFWSLVEMKNRYTYLWKFHTVTVYIALEVQFDIVTVNGLIRGETLTKLEYKCCFLFSDVVKWK